MQGLAIEMAPQTPTDDIGFLGHTMVMRAPGYGTRAEGQEHQGAELHSGWKHVAQPLSRWQHVGGRHGQLSGGYHVETVGNIPDHAEGKHYDREKAHPGWQDGGDSQRQKGGSLA